MYIQATDNYLYKDVVMSYDDCIIQFVELEEPTIILGIPISKSKYTHQRQALKKLRELGIKASLTKNNQFEIIDYVLPNENRIAAQMTFELNGPIPVSWLDKASYRARILFPCMDCRFFAWELPFEFGVICNFIDNNIYNNGLVSFMEGRDIIESELTSELREKIIKKIRRQILKKRYELMIHERRFNETIWLRRKIGRQY